MNSAGHQIMMAPIQKDISWDYDTVFDVRSKFAQELAPVCRMPSLVASYTSTLLQSYTYVVLSIKRGLIGFLGRYNATDQILHYWLFDSENNTWEDTGLTIDIGTTSFSAGIAINRAGKIVFVSRYLGKVWTFDQDGSNLEYVGQTNPNFDTSDGIRVYANYDGSCTVFDMGINNGKKYVIDENFNITQPGTMANVTWPYIYKQLPGKVVVTGVGGHVSVYNEDMTTTLVSNRSVSQYVSLNGGLLMSPFTKDLVMYGMCTKTNKIGINASTYVDFTTAASNRYIESNNVGAYLPTGEYVWRHGYHTSYSTQPICDRIYNQNADIITDIRTMSGTENIGGSWRALPTGKYFDRYQYNGTMHFDLYDFGFDKKYFCPALCISPFGYNP